MSFAEINRSAEVPDPSQAGPSTPGSIEASSNLTSLIYSDEASPVLGGDPHTIDLPDLTIPHHVEAADTVDTVAVPGSTVFDSSHTIGDRPIGQPLVQEAVTRQPAALRPESLADLGGTAMAHTDADEVVTVNQATRAAEAGQVVAKDNGTEDPAAEQLAPVETGTASPIGETPETHDAELDTGGTGIKPPNDRERTTGGSGDDGGDGDGGGDSQEVGEGRGDDRGEGVVAEADSQDREVDGTRIEDDGVRSGDEVKEKNSDNPEAERNSFESQIRSFAAASEDELGYRGWLEMPERGVRIYVREAERPIGPPIGGFDIYTSGEPIEILQRVRCLEIANIMRIGGDSADVDMTDFLHIMGTLAKVAPTTHWKALVFEQIGDPRITDWCERNGWNTHPDWKPGEPYMPDFWYIGIPDEPDRANIVSEISNAG